MLSRYTTHQKLLNLQQQLSCNNFRIQDEFTKDSNRANKYSGKVGGLTIDYSKNLINDEVMRLLIKLASEVNIKQKIIALLKGEKLNFTENRAAWHARLRDLQAKEIQEQLQKQKKIINNFYIRSKRGVTGKAITNIVNIGVGGSDLGPAMLNLALDNYCVPEAKELKFYFISAMDGAITSSLLNKLNPESTLFLIASKSFTTSDTLANARAAKTWLVESYKKLGSIINTNELTNLVLDQHFIGISANKKQMGKWGIKPENQLLFWEWVGGRYSVLSSIGFIVAIKIGMANFLQILKGANELDLHFTNKKINTNLPILMALIDIWHINYWGFVGKAILPYDSRLKFLPSYLQQLLMESNGKSITNNRELIQNSTCPIVWGEIGSNAQHAFYQLMHQGMQKIQCEFIMPLERNEVYIDINTYPKTKDQLEHQHKLAFANAIAQSRALMIGKGDINDKKNLHQYYPGNHPSTLIFIEQVSPRVMGNIIALYEHITFVQAQIWDINPFDQWGVELGKKMAVEILNSEKKNSNFEFDSSTTNAINFLFKTDADK